MVLEASIEEYLDQQVQLHGGFTVKLQPEGVRGIPDRLVILPGRILFVEVKRPRGGVVAELQIWWQERLRALGHEAHIVKNRGEIDVICRVCEKVGREPEVPRRSVQVGDRQG